MKGFQKTDLNGIIEFEEAAWTRLQAKAEKLKKRLEPLDLDLHIERVYYLDADIEDKVCRPEREGYICYVEIGIFKKGPTFKEAEDIGAVYYLSEGITEIQFRKGIIRKGYYVKTADIDAFIKEFDEYAERLNIEGVEKVFIQHEIARKQYDKDLERRMNFVKS